MPDSALAMEDDADARFGTLVVERPADAEAERKKFRIAILGDFSGRASRGALETGDALAGRRPIKLDVDNIEQVIAGFATTLVLPLGKDGAGIEVPLNEFDDLHPDELFENVELFEELSLLRQRVARGDATAISEMQDWGEAHGGKRPKVRARAKGTAVPADRRLGEFQSLIDDMNARMAEPGDVDDMIQRIVAPHVVAAPDPEQESMQAAVDEALSAAMRTVLHHPDFQAVEATWRSLDFLSRRIETGPNVEIVLYDVSAEEWAADLSATDELGESGLFRMLAEEPLLDASQGALSAVFGLYTLEETPPHAELMGRMSKISAWMNAPFMASVSPAFLETKKEDRHPLTAEAWDALRALPEAAYVGLAAPRFLLRLPYGARTEPVDPFDFEEFTLRDGLKGMLWGNPVVLSAVLMAQTAAQGGRDMQLGAVMTANDMPFHFMTDRHGDQVALPCTERLLTTSTMAHVVARGFMPLLSIKGRNEVRQGSFQALGAADLAGPWASIGAVAGRGGGTSAGIAMDDSQPIAAGGSSGSVDPDDPRAHLFNQEEDDPDKWAPPPSDDDEDDDDDDLFGDSLDDDDDDGGDAGDDDLDALLAGFDDEDGDEDDEDAADEDSDDDDMDAELAALLEDL